MSDLISGLSIQNLELYVNLGWEAPERAEKQVVQLTVDVTLMQLPAACTSDELKDTFCYAKLIEKIHAAVKDQSYRLIEHLCHDLFQLIKKELPPRSALSLRLTKHPAIDGLTGGVTFNLIDGSVT